MAWVRQAVRVRYGPLDNYCQQLKLLLVYLFMESEGGSNIIGDLFSGLFAVWAEMWGAFIGIAPKVFKFVIWILCGIIILPCVFIAGNIYPKWAEWGEKF
jgi:hypothetical protein